MNFWNWLIVTPLAGVWIEIDYEQRIQEKKPSHPSRVCGLKFLRDV